MASKRTRRAKHRTKPTTTAAQRRRGRSYATARSVVNSAEREPIELKDHEVEEGLATGEHSGLLEDYFGSAQYSELRNLAQEAAVRGKRGGDRVLILPGIMGSKLGYRGSLLFDDVIWANPVAIAFGRLSELRLGAKRNGVDALGVLELVLEDDDATSGLDRGPPVDEFPRAGGDPQLVAGVAPVPALRAERGDQTGLTDGSEEARRGAEHLGCPAHRVRGVVVVVETTAERSVCCHFTSLWHASRGPDAVRHQGPEGIEHHLPALLRSRPSVSAAGPG